MDGVAALVNATNANVAATADDYNGVVIPRFGDAIHSQINDLHDLVSHFNRGKLN